MPCELFAQMVSYEHCLDKQSDGQYLSSSANVVSCGHSGPWTHGGSSGYGHGHDPSHGTARGSLALSCGDYSNNYCRAPDAADKNKPHCQVCFKVGHTASNCWYHFDEEFVPDNHLAASMSPSGSSNPNWYLDSGTTDHITSDLEKLMMHEWYNGNEQIKVTNGASMNIVHVGNSVPSQQIAPYNFIMFYMFLLLISN
jgi:hypothetical protein